MTEAEAIAFYVRQVAGHARCMPLAEAVQFLRGALAVAADHEAMKDLKGTFVDLHSADDQLELIAGAQLRLPLDDKPGHDGQHDGSKP